MRDLHTEVLIALKESTSANSISYSDLLAATNAKDKELFSIIDAMYVRGLVNRCYITRAGWTDNYYWLTGFKGKAQSKGPEPTGIKKEVSHKAEPITWTAIKEKKQIPATQPEDKDITMSKINKSDAVRKLIDETPGITAKELLNAIYGDITEASAVTNANAVISYAAKHSDYICVQERKPYQSRTERCFYNVKDYQAKKIPDEQLTKPSADKSSSSPNIAAEPAQAKQITIPAALTLDGNDTDYCIKRISEQLSDDATIVISKEKGGAILVTVTHAAHIYKPNLEKISACLSAIQILASLQVSLPN